MVEASQVDTALVGMKEICQFVRRSEPTVIVWIRDMDFPAKKIGGIWESDKVLVQKWRRKYIEVS